MNAEDLTLKIEGILFDSLLHPKERRKRAIEAVKDYERKAFDLGAVSDSSQWTCEKCGTVSNEEVTFEETHDGCGGYCS